jgi:hypothetical protein
MISNNDPLIFSSKDIATTICRHLIKSNPESITTTDSFQDRMPFLSVIEDWYNYYNGRSNMKQQQPQLSVLTATINDHYKSGLRNLGMTQAKSRKSTGSQHANSRKSTDSQQPKSKRGQYIDYKKKSSSIFHQNHNFELNNSFSHSQNDDEDSDLNLQSKTKITAVDKTYVELVSKTYSQDNESSPSNTITTVTNKKSTVVKTDKTYVELRNTFSHDDSTSNGPPANGLRSMMLMSKQQSMYPISLYDDAHVVEVWEEVEWCFQMLSYAVHVLDDQESTKVRSNNASVKDRRSLLNSSTIMLDETPEPKRRGNKDKDDNPKENQSTLLLRHILKVVPNVVCIILLIESDEDRIRILQEPIVRRLLLCPESVGTWLPSLLRRKNKCRLAIDYLVLISNLTLKDYTSNNTAYGAYYNQNHDSGNDIVEYSYQQFRRSQRSVFLGMKRTNGTLASLALLETPQIERATSTTAVRNVFLDTYIYSSSHRLILFYLYSFFDRYNTFYQKA